VALQAGLLDQQWRHVAELAEFPVVDRGKAFLVAAGEAFESRTFPVVGSIGRVLELAGW
jgi:hypothetical protein